MTNEEALSHAVPAESSTTPADSNTTEFYADSHRKQVGGEYQELAAYMGTYPAAAIFRRFSTLRMLRLLYLQAELSGLAIQLNFVADLDANSPDTHWQKYCRDYWELKRRLKDPDTQDKRDRQQQTLKQIADALKKYDKEILRNKAVVEMSRPSFTDQNHLVGWMRGVGNIRLTGLDT